MRVLFIITLAIGLLAAKAQLQHWSDVDLGQAVQEGAADQRHLWLRGADGVLVRFDRQTGERTVLGRGVFELMQDGDRLWAASRAEDAGEVAIIDLKHIERPPITVDVGDEIVGLFATRGDGPGLLTAREVLQWDDGRWKRDPLAAELKCGDFPASYGQVAAGADGRLYFGCNVGEWGGGLRRIDPATGSATLISEASDEACGGLLNPDCDPVVGVFPDSQEPDCMTVGTSLAHMLTTGQVLRVCGDRITAVFADPVGTTRRGFTPTWAFDSLVPTRDGWVAVSQRRYARSRAGSVEMQRTPALKNWSGLRISEEQDGVLFVLQGCCWGAIDHPTEFRVLAIPVEPTP